MAAAPSSGAAACPPSRRPSPRPDGAEDFGAAELRVLELGPLETVLTTHNLGAKPCRKSFKVEHAAGSDGLVDPFGRGEFSLSKDGTVRVELEGYGCRWLRVRYAGDIILLQAGDVARRWWGTTSGAGRAVVFAGRAVRPSDHSDEPAAASAGRGS